MSERCRIDVDLAAVTANARWLAGLGPELWAVVKADGYGHGALACARAALAGGAQRLCVATVGEGLAVLEELGSDAPPVLLMSPLAPGEEMRLRAPLEPCVSSREHAERVVAADVTVAVHVKADTGMGRWGMPPAAALALGRDLSDGRLGTLTLAGLMSHLATSDSDPAFAREQADVYDALARDFPPCPRHLGNSAAALRLPWARHDAVRCGIALYGVSPDDGDPAAEGLAPALRWTSRVALVKELPAGGSSGYGRRLRTPEAARVALVPVGYADGYPRALSGLSDVLIGGVRRRVAATVSMDQLTCLVDEGVREGDEVVLVGAQGSERIGPEELARHAGTIGYEIVCSAGAGARRAPRHHSSGG